MPSPDASPSANGRPASASTALSRRACGPATRRADTVSGCWDPPPRHGSRCRSGQSYAHQPAESATERCCPQHWRWHTPTLRSTPTDSIRDTVSPRQSSDDWRGLCGQSAAAAAFAHRMDQLNPIGVDDAEHRRSGQEDLRPVLMGPEEAKEPGPLGEAGEQRPIVARQPPIKRAVPPAFEGMEQPQGDHLTRPEVGLGVFGDSAQLLIDLVEQRGDKIQGDHTALLACGKDVTQTSVEESSDDRKPKNLYQ